MTDYVISTHVYFAYCVFVHQNFVPNLVLLSVFLWPLVELSEEK